MKRGKPLRRTGGLSRGGSLSRGKKLTSAPQTKSKKRKSPKRKTRYALRERDTDYMVWVKSLPCLLAGTPGAGPCTGVVEADHAGLDAGLTQKAPDDTCIPLCTGHHEDRHACTGFFRGREKAWKREWRVHAIEETRAAHEFYNCGLVSPARIE